MTADSKRKSQLAIIESDPAYCQFLKQSLKYHYNLILFQPGLQNKVPGVDGLLWGPSITVEQCQVLLGVMEQSPPQLMLCEDYNFHYRLQARRLGVLSFLPADCQREELLLAVYNILQHNQSKAKKGKGLFLPTVIRAIDAHLKAHSDIDVGTLCRRLNLSQSTVYRRIKGATGKSTQQFLLQQKCRRAAIQLRESDRPIAEVAYNTGFSSPSHLCSVFRKQQGCSPHAYRNGTTE